MKIADLTLVLHSDERTIQSFSLDGRTDAQAREWLGEQLGARGLDARALDASSPYEMPAHAVTQGGAYGVEDVADALVELAAWFANAEYSLVRVQLAAINFASAAVQISPAAILIVRARTALLKKNASTQ